MSTSKKTSTTASTQDQQAETKLSSDNAATTTTDAVKNLAAKAEAKSAETAKAVEETVALTKENMETAMRTTQEAYTKSLDESLDTAKDHVAKSSEQLTKGWTEASQNGQETLKAWSDAHTALIKGAEDVAKIWFGTSQTLIDQSIHTTKAIMTASSLSEIVDLQSAHAKTSFDTMVSEMTRMSELSLKAANEAMSPLNSRVNAAMEKAGKPLAA